MIERGEGRLQVSGEVTIDTVSTLFSELVKQGLSGAAGKELIVDLARLEKVDSSAVSLMLSWLREARRGNTALTFINVPENLSSLARLYGVAEMLNLEAA